jgi:hypothetical protein
VTWLDLISQSGESRRPKGASYAASTADDLARRLAEKVLENCGEGATVKPLVLVASVTEEDGAERDVVESNGLLLHQQAGTLRHAVNALTMPR